MMKAGATAQVKAPVVRGEIKERRFAPDDSLEYLLEYTDATGAVQQRWFPETELEEVVQ